MGRKSKNKKPNKMENIEKSVEKLSSEVEEIKLEAEVTECKDNSTNFVEEEKNEEKVKANMKTSSADAVADVLKLAESFSKKEICELIDKLLIEMLRLTEEHVRCKIDMEKRQNEGSLLLAKARYIGGGKSVSTSQLPTEDSADFNALLTVSRIDSEYFSGSNFNLVKHPVDKSKGYLDPTKWFGVLVPRSLQFAKERYQNAIELAIESANIQKEMQSVISYIHQLKMIKNNM